MRIPRLLASVLGVGALAVPTLAACQPAPANQTRSTSAAVVAATTALWTPPKDPNFRWQWQITGKVNTSVSPASMFDIDLQDAVPSTQTVTSPLGTSTWAAGENAGVIPALHAQGKIVICYLSTGAWENWRPDASLFPASSKKNSDGWPGEKWLDIRPAAWASWTSIMWARMDLAARIGCDGVEPDQNNPIGNNPGYTVTTSIQKAWYLEVARQAHLRGLSVGMKNGVETTDADTAAAFDWNLNEECNQYSECDTLKPFLDAGKLVLNAEYKGTVSATSGFCKNDQTLGISGNKFKLSLGGFRQVCP
jgi:hypothetical protein